MSSYLAIQLTNNDNVSSFQKNISTLFDKEVLFFDFMETILIRKYHNDKDHFFKNFKDIVSDVYNLPIHYFLFFTQCKSIKSLKKEQNLIINKLLKENKIEEINKQKESFESILENRYFHFINFFKSLVEEFVQFEEITNIDTFFEIKNTKIMSYSYYNKIDFCNKELFIKTNFESSYILNMALEYMSYYDCKFVFFDGTNEVVSQKSERLKNKLLKKYPEIDKIIS